MHGSETNARTIQTALAGSGHTVLRARSAAEALLAISKRSVDLVLIDLSESNPGCLDFCRFLKKTTATQVLPVYVIGSNDDVDDEVKAFEAGADEFLVTPIRPRAFQARVQATLRYRSMIDSLDDSETVLFSLAQSVEDRDPELGQHCHRLALMGAAMGLTIGLPSADVLALQRGGYLHDIGKIVIPDHILFKPGPLTSEEWEVMKTHTERGARICEGIKSLATVVPIIRHHHEKWDGSGYPHGLRGEEIPLLARVLQVADIYDALTTERPYKPAATPVGAFKVLREEAERGWRDPKLVEMFGDILPMFRSTPVSTDHSHFSLHALARSVERLRGEPDRVETISDHELRLVS